MKQFVAAALSATAAYAGSSACLYCRNQDLNGGFLVSYSYCEQTDICLKDAWNYINRECLYGWTRGNTLALSSCEPEEVSCPSFESSEEKYQKYKNTTWSIAAGSKCNVVVDATQGIARVIFSSTAYLGIEFDASIDEIITIESGVTEIEIYNAAESGPITFGISFSGAANLLTAAAAGAAVALLAF